MRGVRSYSAIARELLGFAATAETERERDKATERERERGIQRNKEWERGSQSSLVPSCTLADEQGLPCCFVGVTI